MTKERHRCDVLAVILDVALMLENSTVFQSQVVDQLVALRRLGFAVSVLAVSRNEELFEALVGRRVRSAGVRVFLVQDRGFLRNLLSMTGALRRMNEAQVTGTAYVRGIWGAVVLGLANFPRKPRYVYDVRGALSDETSAVGRTRIKQRIYISLERWGIRRAARVTAVTQALAKVVSQAHLIESVEVVPCCVDIAAMSVSNEEAQVYRRHLGYAESDIVLVYSGGLSHYQQVPATLSLWRRLCDDHRVRFLLLTNDDPHSAPEVVGDLSDFGERLRHMSLRRNEVPLALAAADAGFMLRDTRELNRVASPVKFAEYLAAGLAVVASPGTGDASELIERNQLGALVDPQQPDEGELRVREMLRALSVERESIRSKARELAAERYDWLAYRSTFNRLYKLI